MNVWSDATSGDGKPVTVFVVDDHELVRLGLTDLISAHSDLQLVGTAATAAEAVARIIATRPDVAVLDARLPDGSGIEVCRDVRAALPGTRVLILTSYDDNDAVIASVMAGASGYLLKEIRGMALVEAIRQIAAGRSLLDSAVTEQVMKRLREGEPSDDRLSSLTDREREVLRHISEGRSNREIGELLFLSDKTVKNYVSRLLAKLGMQRRAQVAVFGASALPPVP